MTRVVVRATVQVDLAVAFDEGVTATAEQTIAALRDCDLRKYIERAVQWNDTYLPHLYLDDDNYLYLDTEAGRPRLLSADFVDHDGKPYPKAANA